MLRRGQGLRAGSEPGPARGLHLRRAEGEWVLLGRWALGDREHGSGGPHDLSLPAMGVRARRIPILGNSVFMLEVQMEKGSNSREERASHSEYLLGEESIPFRIPASPRGNTAQQKEIKLILKFSTVRITEHSL